MTIMVTGGAGYIGSHGVQRLLRDGHRVVAVDNLFRGHRAAIDRLRATDARDRLTFVPADVGDSALTAKLIVDHKVEAVMHFAALAYVGESVDHPLMYYRNNAGGTLGLLEGIDRALELGQAVERMVFSSTCASYGEPTPDLIPIPETCPQRPINAYGWSKLHCERELMDYATAATRRGRKFSFAALRYFNVAGSDRTGLIGEDHTPETHIIPVCIQTIMGSRAHFGMPANQKGLTIFGTDYPTPDGTCVRDYVHVEDLIDAHVSVLAALRPGEQRAYNLGIGRGYSVRQIIDSVKRVTGKALDAAEGPRRAGDPAELFAKPDKIRSEIGWTAKVTDLDEIVRSAWNWYQANPRGYR